jgi:flavin-dependent dehydrogenase
LRSEFDKLMLDNARQHGVEVHEGVRVTEVLMEGDRAVGVRLLAEDGTPREVRCRVVVDASGQSSVLMSRLGLRQWDPELKKAALWTYFKGPTASRAATKGPRSCWPCKAERAGSGTSRCTTTW